jgi:putative transposase
LQEKPVVRSPFTHLYVHLVWATWDRLPLITGEIERTPYAAIRLEADKLRVEVLELGGVEDHVHVLARLPTTVSVAELAKQLKGSTSHLVTHRLIGVETFKWQGGYGAFSVSKSGVPRVAGYIQNQRAHIRPRRST